ncbi:MAG: hypothetical protein M9920_12155 [Verrucomicrobiae bacterium]|nr:hypothetical protein [Verrucomicrobiae bacterium]
MASDLTQFQALLATAAPAQLGPQPRPGTLPRAELEARLTALLTPAPPSASRRQLVRALVLLWHDHLDAAHTLVQSLPDPEASFIHAIMHRREPDYWNSKYWWRRVGAHPVFSELALRAQELFAAQPGVAALKISPPLIRNGRWVPDAFVDLCERAVNENLPLDGLRELQRLEFATLLEFLLRS